MGGTSSSYVPAVVPEYSFIGNTAANGVLVVMFPVGLFSTPPAVTVTPVNDGGAGFQSCKIGLAPTAAQVTVQAQRVIFVAGLGTISGVSTTVHVHARAVG